MTKESAIKRILSKVTTPAAMPLPIKNNYIRIAARVIGWAILLLLPVYCLFMTEYIHYANQAQAIRFFFERTPVVIFDLCIMYLLWFCLLCLVKKGWAASLIYSGIFSIAALVDYLKYAMTGDYFYPWDLVQQAGNVGELGNFITVPFPVLYIALILFGLLLTVPVYISGASLPLRWYVRYPLLALTAGCMIWSVSTPSKITHLLNSNSLYLEDMSLQTSNYTANGFVAAFTINVLSSNIQQPEDYSQESIERLLESYSPEEATAEFSSPDIILILSESFWDPTELPGTTFSQDPLDDFRALCQEENTISGTFYTTGFGGGTVRPEFEVLTGLTTDYLPSGSVPWQYVDSATPSYVSVYKELGYSTMAIHPYTSSFYSRKNAYPLIGIDTLHFEDDLYALSEELDLTLRGGQISDETFANAIMYYMDQGDADDPQFVFGISMENHQPYTDKFDTHAITVTGDSLDSDVLNAVANYTQGIADADDCLRLLTDYIDSRERDTILIWYGDHKPTLGSNHGAYIQSGLISPAESWDSGDYETLFSTPFLIYANFELQESSMLHPGSDNQISSYNLMNGVSELIGAPRTTLMNYLKDYCETVPYYNIRLHQPLSDLAEQFTEGHKLLTYDVLAGKQYSLN